MAIHCEIALEIARPVPAVFAFVDDEAQAPRWLGRAQKVNRTSAGPKGVGATLHYTYKDGMRGGGMDGVVTEYEKDRRLAMKYSDPMFDVAIAFGFSPSGTGTRVEHAVDITPKSFLGRLMSPIIRAATRKQIARDTGVLKNLLEASA